MGLAEPWYRQSKRELGSRGFQEISHGYPAEVAEDYRKLLRIYSGNAGVPGRMHVTEHLKAVDDAAGPDDPHCIGAHRR